MNRSLVRTTIALAAALAALGGGAPALAQSNAAIDELKAEIRKLREEVEALKKGAAVQPAAAAAAAGQASWGDRIEAVEIKAKDAVVGGDIGGSFRLPGSETSVRVYGFAEGNLVHDFKKPGQSDIFTDLMFQPLDRRAPPFNSEVPNGKTKLTASTSRFGFETSTPTAAGSLTTKIETDFYSYGAGNRNRLRLRHAYGEYAGWLVGQTWSTFMDLDDLPETVDFNGPIGAPFSRRSMIRYTFGDAKAGYKFTAALEDPEDQFGGGSAGERLPQIVLRFDKSFDGAAFNVRLLGHEKRSATMSKRALGFAIGGNYKIGAGLLMAQYTKLDGDVDQLYGSNGYAIASDGTITFDKNQGLVLGYAHTFSPELRANVGFGMNKGKTAEAVDNKSLKQLHLNMFYTPVKNVDLGAEYVRGTRKTFDGDSGTMSRIDLLARYSF